MTRFEEIPAGDDQNDGRRGSPRVHALRRAAIAALAAVAIPSLASGATPPAADTLEPPSVVRTTIGDVHVDVRIGGNLRVPPDAAEFFRFAAPRAIRGSMLPTTSELAAIRIDPRVHALVAELDSPDWSVREDAANELLALEVAEDQLLAVLAQAGRHGELSAEQWSRLLEVVCDRLRDAPRGALGIRMAQRWDGLPGVLVTDLLPGMPAERVLRIGDRIIEINGRPLMTSEDLIELVQLRRPGERIALRVARPRRDANGREVVGPNGQIPHDDVQVAMELGDADQLDRHQDAPIALGPGMGRGGALPQRGAQGQPGSVSRLRAEQAEEARARFALPPIAVRIGGPRPSTDMSVLPDPDEHDSMSTMRLYRQLLDDGAITATPSMRRAWQATLRMLEERAEDRTLPEAIRAHYREIARRYAELIPAP